jgi:hypothetical protein
MAVRLAELDGIPFDMLSTSEAVARRAEQVITDVVEPARTVALERLDEDRQAAVIATRWLRERVGRGGEGGSSAATL